MDKQTSRFLIGTGIVTIALGIFLFGKKNKKAGAKKVTDKKEVGNNFKLPKRFIDDVEQMENEEIEATIKGNEQILKTSKVTENERQAIDGMLQYLRTELKKRA